MSSDSDTGSKAVSSGEAPLGGERPDEAVRRPLAALLRGGVALGLAPIATGLVLCLASGSCGQGALPSLGGLISGVARGDGASLILLGVAVFLALPPLQALAALVSYRRLGNRRFAATSLAVLLVQIIAVTVAWIR
ncbi:MAG: DUF1634 domain-containing protein [Bacillota bacterium]|jgi:uncharacterized membrane protein|nr:MAG: DUF1634 domain-containing protein [Bacillota bacterium]